MRVRRLTSLTVLLAGCGPNGPITTTRSLRLAELPTSSRPNLEYTFDCSMVSLSDQPHFKLADRNSMVERLRPNSIDDGVEDLWGNVNNCHCHLRAHSMTANSGRVHRQPAGEHPELEDPVRRWLKSKRRPTCEVADPGCEEHDDLCDSYYGIMQRFTHYDYYFQESVCGDRPERPSGDTTAKREQYVTVALQQTAIRAAHQNRKIMGCRRDQLLRIYSGEAGFRGLILRSWAEISRFRRD